MKSIKPGYAVSGWASADKSMERACRWACPPWRATLIPPTYFYGRCSRSFCLQQGRARTWSGCGCVEDLLPSHTRNEVSCGVGTVALLNVCSVWPCGFCVFIVGWATHALLIIGVPEALGGLYSGTLRYRTRIRVSPMACHQ